MRRSRGRIIDVDTLEDFDRRLAAGAHGLSGWRVRGLDLTGRIETLADDRALSGATFLGCAFGPGEAARVTAAGALVLPAITSVPVDVYRGRLYTADELYDDPSYARSLDGRAYSWSQDAHARDDALAIALHDHAIDDALATWTARRHLVGVMGAHAAERGTAAYAGAARLGHLLGRDHVVATGGGPGAMEAANLGASLAARPAEALDEALPSSPRCRRSGPRSTPGCGPRSRPGTCTPDPADSWASPPGTTATSRRTCSPRRSRSTSATRPARRSCSRCATQASSSSPGAGGTVQEIFQDACENYYADESSVAPMVLVGREVLDRDAARLAAAPVAGARPGDGGARAPRRHVGRQRRLLAARWRTRTGGVAARELTADGATGGCSPPGSPILRVSPPAGPGRDAAITSR